jgi:hypothetical protein
MAHFERVLDEVDRSTTGHGESVTGPIGVEG